MSELQRITEELVAELIKHKTLLTEVLNNTSIQQLVKETHDAKHLTERNTESKVLAVIHAYDETAESKLSRIWQILGEKA